jgi:hypothetical protein
MMLITDFDVTPEPLTPMTGLRFGFSGLTLFAADEGRVSLGVVFTGAEATISSCLDEKIVLNQPDISSLNLANIFYRYVIITNPMIIHSNGLLPKGILNIYDNIMSQKHLNN